MQILIKDVKSSTFSLRQIMKYLDLHLNCDGEIMHGFVSYLFGICVHIPSEKILDLVYVTAREDTFLLICTFRIANSTLSFRLNV